MTKPGPLHWAPRPHYRSGLFLGGYRFDADRPLDHDRPEGFATAENLARTWCSQSRWVGADQPLDIAPWSGSIKINAKWEEEAQAIGDALSVGEPQRVFFGRWQTDYWAVEGAAGAQTEWRTSRGLPYDLPAPLGAADWAAYVPQVKLIDTAGVAVEQTVITAGTPGAGEVLVPDTGGGTYETIQTPAVSTLTGMRWLALYYPAVLHCVVVEKASYPVANGLEWVLGFRELPAGVYEGAAA